MIIPHKKCITDEEYHDFNSYPSIPQKFYVASDTWVPPQTTNYIKIRTGTRKSSFAIKVDKFAKDNGPYYNLNPVPCIYAQNTRQIQYRNTHNRGINLLEDEFVAKFNLLKDNYTPPTLENNYNTGN